jgi:transcriptional regulator with XRE-family HTH domain
VNRHQEFGQRLRNHREGRGIGLDEIARLTKVSSSLLAAMERGDCSRWPGGIYGRAYIRAYAAAVGLDADRISSDFAQCFPEIAWPEKPPARALPRSEAHAEESEPLRILLDHEPEGRWLRIAEQAAVSILGAAAAIAAVFALTMALGSDNHWKALCLTGAVYHVAVLILYQRSPRSWFSRVRRRAIRPAPPSAESPSLDPAVGEPLEVGAIN